MSTMSQITEKTEMLEIDPNNDAASNTKVEEKDTETVPNLTENQLEKEGNEENKSVEKEEKIELKEKEVEVVIEPKTGVSFPVVSDDGKELKAVGLRKKGLLGIGIKVYGFGIYAENEKLKDLLNTKFGTAPSKPTEEMFQAVIDSDVGMMVRLVIVFSALTMSMVRKSFNETLGASIKKLTGEKNEELAKKVMAGASDDMKLSSGSVIEISKLPGYTLQAKVRGEIVGTAQSELLCRAYFHMYLGDEPFDKEAKEKFGISILSLL